MDQVAKPQYTLRGILIVLLVLGVLAAFLIPTYLRVRRQLSRATCSSSLRSLWQVQLNRFSGYGHHGDQLSNPETGSDFWLSLQRGSPPIFDRYEVFFCVDSGDEIAPGRTSYRGPVTNVNKVDGKDPVGADKEGNHGAGEGGNVLTRLGDVGMYAETDSLWIRARSTTRD